jgi:hypothetical protein
MPNPVIPDLAVPIRTALLGNATITADLATYAGAPAIFTRRPAPPDAKYPMIMVSPNVAKTDRDGIDDLRPIITRDIAVYNLNDNPDQYRVVETLADIIYSMFHYERNSLGSFSNGWSVTTVYCTGPIPAPADDDMHVGRVVTLVIFLANNAGF